MHCLLGPGQTHERSGWQLPPRRRSEERRPSPALGHQLPQRGNIYQPRVARNELPWVPVPAIIYPERVATLPGRFRRAPSSWLGISILTFVLVKPLPLWTVWVNHTNRCATSLSVSRDEWPSTDSRLYT